MDERLANKWWRLTHLYKVKAKSGDLVTFRPNRPQLMHLAERGAHRRGQIVKARQFGFTTLYCIDMLDEALWVPGMSCAILAHERESVDKIFQIVKRAYESLPEPLRPTVNKDTERAYRFERRFDGVELDSEIYVALKLRSSTVRWLHVTESAYIKDRQELEAGSKQAVPLDGRITEETTGNGFNAFYDAYMAARNNPEPGEFGYRAYFYPWFSNSEYTLPGEIDQHEPEERALRDSVKREYGVILTDGQLLWRRWKKRSLVMEGNLAGLTGEQLFKQEYPSTVTEAFQSGAGAVFNAEHIEQAEKTAKPVLRVDKGLTIWVEPQLGHRYMLGSDPSDGIGADYGVIDVWDVDTLEQVAQFIGKLRPDELAEKIRDVAVAYSRAYVGVENNMLSTILFLVKIYDNYYVTKTEDKRTKQVTEKIGWTTSSKSRDLMIDEFLIAFDEGELTINSRVTLDQMRTFVKTDNGKREHAPGKHDDALIAAMIAYQMRKDYPATDDEVTTAGDYSSWYK